MFWYTPDIPQEDAHNAQCTNCIPMRLESIYLYMLVDSVIHDKAPSGGAIFCVCPLLRRLHPPPRRKGGESKGTDTLRYQ